MANIERGEVELIVNDRAYTLKLTMNAAITTQKRTGKTIGELLGKAAALDVEAIRDIVFVLLQKHHADEFKNVSAAGDFIDDAGGIAKFFSALEELGKANEDPNANPPMAQETRTGGGSSETPGASAA